MINIRSKQTRKCDIHPTYIASYLVGNAFQIQLKSVRLVYN